MTNHNDWIGHFEKGLLPRQDRFFSVAHAKHRGFGAHNIAPRGNEDLSAPQPKGGEAVRYYSVGVTLSTIPLRKPPAAPSPSVPILAGLNEERCISRSAFLLID
jgi:hypothetical protein